MQDNYSRKRLGESIIVLQAANLNSIIRNDFLSWREFGASNGSLESTLNYVGCKAGET